MSTSLSNHTTMQVGGPAMQFVEAGDRQALIEAVQSAWASTDPCMVLGGGSNVIFADRGFDGTVIHIASRGIERVNDSTVRVQAGEIWDEVVVWSVNHGLSGLEALSGIPGTAGAAPIQNIGAYGQELSSVLTAVEFLDQTTGQISWLPAETLQLSYRDSVFKHDKRGVVLAIELSLSQHTREGRAVSAPIEFDQLASALGVARGAQVALEEVRRSVLLLRAGKGMLFDSADADTHGCGSFFVNPIVTENFARNLPADMPRFPVDPAAELQMTDRILQLADDVPALASVSHVGPHLVKLSAAWLIEHSGVTKGYRIPGSKAAISSKHTLAITNTGGATADEIVGLARYVQAMVQSHFGVMLQPEPTLVGVEL